MLAWTKLNVLMCTMNHATKCIHTLVIKTRLSHIKFKFIIDKNEIINIEYTLFELNHINVKHV